MVDASINKSQLKVVVKMKDLIEVAGFTLDNADALAQRLGIKSERTAHLLLKKWRDNLSDEDWNFVSSQALPDKTDIFSLYGDL